MIRSVWSPRISYIRCRRRRPSIPTSSISASIRRRWGRNRGRRSARSRPPRAALFQFSFWRTSVTPLAQRDLALGGFGPPRHEVFHLGLGFRRDALGLGLGAFDDVPGLALGAGVTGLVFGEQFGGLVLEAAGVVEFAPDAVAAVIERRQHGAVNAVIDEHADQDDEGDGDPEFRFGEHRFYPYKYAATAWSSDLPSADTPVSRCTIAAAASAAMPRTLPIAVRRVEAMVVSASASLTASCCSSVLRSASEAALSFSRVSAPIACARERAAASSLS